jgi:hypothetical protein
VFSGLVFEFQARRFLKISQSEFTLKMATVIRGETLEYLEQTALLKREKQTNVR